MSKATIIIEGFLAADPEIRQANGKSVANFTIPHTDRAKNKQTGDFEDVGDTLWVRVALWERDADLAAQHLRKGVLVRVEGTPVLKAWERDGKSGTNLEIKFASFSIIPRADRNATQQPSAPAQDSWSAPTAYGDDTPF